MSSDQDLLTRTLKSMSKRTAINVIDSLLNALDKSGPDEKVTTFGEVRIFLEGVKKEYEAW